MSPDKKPTCPVDIYVRVSRVGERGGESFQSPAQQEERCRGQLTADGLKVGQVFVDLDQSGAKASRPAFDEMLARLGELDGDGKLVQGSQASGGVIVHDLSRFGRNTRNVLDGIEYIESRGGIFISCAEKLDTSTATGRFVITLFAALREMELDQSRERWELSKQKARDRGVHIGAARAGYIRREDGTLAEHPEHIQAVKGVFAVRAHGGSWWEASELLTAAGVPTSKSKGQAKVWSRQATRNLVENRAYRADNGGPIPNWQWQKAQAKPGAPRVRGVGHVLGGGLVRCGTCGAGMHKSSNGQRYQVIRCEQRGPGHPTMGYETARDFILSLTFSHVGPRLKREPGGGEAEREALQLAVEAASAEYEQAMELLGVTPPSDSKPALALTEAEAALAEFEVKATAPLTLADLLTPVGVKEQFEKLPVPEQRRILRQIIERVTLSTGRGDPGNRIVVEFTDGTRWPADPLKHERLPQI